MGISYKCLVCEHEKSSELFIATDHTVSKETFSIEKCDRCGFISTADIPAEEEIGRYYNSDDYTPHDSKGGGTINTLYRIVRGRMLRYKLSIIRESGIPEGALLDYGAGTGEFASYAASQGYSVTGVEINSKAREVAAEGSGALIIHPSQMDEMAANSINCVTMWHVLEHLHNPGLFMDRVKSLLRSKGLLIVAVPNIDSTDSSFYRGDWAALDVPRHLWHFSPESFKSFARTNGFEVIGIKRLFFDAFYVSILSEKNRGSNLALLRAFAVGKVSAIVSIFNKRKCSSLVYICRIKETA